MSLPERFQRRDAILERRMAHEQSAEPAAHAAVVNPEGLQLARQWLPLGALQDAQRPDHALRARKVRSARVRPILPAAGEVERLTRPY